MPVALKHQTAGIPWKCEFVRSPAGHIFVAHALHPDSTQRDLLIVCNPIAEEAKSSFAAANQLCAEVWANGWHVVRFDYVGTGDSEGSFLSTTPSDWIFDSQLIMQEVISRFSAKRLVAMGVRLGANIAAHAVTAMPSVPNPMLVLWEPVLDLEAYIRHLSWVSRTPHGEAGIDYFGWPLTNACIADMKVILPLQPSHFKCPSFIANVSTRSYIGREFEEIRPHLDASSELFHFRSRPFWELIGKTDCGALVQRTRAWMTDSESKAEPC